MLENAGCTSMCLNHRHLHHYMGLCHALWYGIFYTTMHSTALELTKPHFSHDLSLHVKTGQFLPTFKQKVPNIHGRLKTKMLKMQPAVSLEAVLTLSPSLRDKFLAHFQFLFMFTFFPNQVSTNFPSHMSAQFPSVCLVIPTISHHKPKSSKILREWTPEHLLHGCWGLLPSSSLCFQSTISIAWQRLDNARRKTWQCSSPEQTGSNCLRVCSFCIN